MEVSPGLKARWVANGEDRSHPRCPASCHCPGTKQQAEPWPQHSLCAPEGVTALGQLCDSSGTAVSLLGNPTVSPCPYSHTGAAAQPWLSLEVKPARTGPGCSSLLLCWDEGHLLPDGHFGWTNAAPGGPGVVAREGFVLGTSSELRAAQGHPSLGCAPALELSARFCCPNPAGTSPWALQGVSNPSLRPTPPSPTQAGLLTEVGATREVCVPKCPCLFSSPSPTRVSPFCRGVGWSQLSSTGSLRLSGVSPQAWTRRDNLKTRAQT